MIFINNNSSRGLLISFLFFSSLLFWNWHPYKPEMNLKEADLNGPVKTVFKNVPHWDSRAIVIQYYNKRGFLTKINYYSSPEIIDTVIDNHEIKSERFSHYRGLDTSKFVLRYSINYKHDSIGNIIHEKRVKKNDNDYLLDWQKFRSYNNRNYLIREEYYNYDTSQKVRDSFVHKYIHKYNNRMYKKTQVNLSNNPVDTIRHKRKNWNKDSTFIKVKKVFNGKPEYYTIHLDYNNSGKVDSITWLSFSDSTYNNQTGKGVKTFKFYKNNSIICKKYVRYKDGKIKTFELDSSVYQQGDLLEKHIKEKSHKALYNDSIGFTGHVSVYNKEGNVTKWYKRSKNSSDTIYYKYKYDKHDNWVKRKRFKNDTMTNIDMRRLNYYK